MTTGSSHRDEVRAGQRFEFGRNWRKFLWAIDEERIREAERSLAEMLEPTILRGVRFLDVGSGSGLFSLAARRLGAKVHSFDYDPESVDCTRELKNRYCPGDDEWIIEAGSVLDKQYLESIGKFELVYAWGVLHHTGSMWAALENVLARVAENGRLFTAIYNNQGWKSVIWRGVKKTWCSGCLGRAAVGSVFIPLFALAEVSKNLLSGRNPLRLCDAGRSHSVLPGPGILAGEARLCREAPGKQPIRVHAERRYPGLTANLAEWSMRCRYTGFPCSCR
jgi:2-polyprenyl-6-hydroxyphenyl methylase/3-demethylubiquinone-9 3-methyltransferase